MTAPTDKKPTTAAIGITLQQAQTTKWPFGVYKGQPMGALVDSKKLSLKDLGYAAENAWEDRVRRAAMALMLVRLNLTVNEPPPSAGYVRVVSGGRSFSVRRQFQYFLFEGFLLGIAFAVCIGVAIWQLSMWHPERQAEALSQLGQITSSPSGLLGFVIAIGLIALIVGLPTLLFDKVLAHLDKQIANHRKGEEGEAAVIALLSQLLDGSWAVFRNVLLPGRKGGDLDIVLVGQAGVWVLETKYYAGEYRNIGEHWEYRKGNRWKLLRKSPSRQATNNALGLSNFLKAEGVAQWITPVVIWVNPDGIASIENPSTAVWTLNRLPDEIGNVWHGKPISEENRRKIVEKLTKLCERQKEKSAQHQQ